MRLCCCSTFLRSTYNGAAGCAFQILASCPFKQRDNDSSSTTCLSTTENKNIAMYHEVELFVNCVRKLVSLEPLGPTQIKAKDRQGEARLQHLLRDITSTALNMQQVFTDICCYFDLQNEPLPTGLMKLPYPEKATCRTSLTPTITGSTAENKAGTNSSACRESLFLEVW